MPIPSKFGFFLLGFLVGLGFWIQPTIAYYLLPAGLFLLLKKPRLVFSRNIFWLLLGVVLGGAPVWYANLTSGAQTAHDLFNKPWGVRRALVGLGTLGLPILLGTRSSWQYRDFFTPLAVGVWLLYGLGLIYLVVKRVREFGEFRGFRELRGKLSGVDLWLGMLASILLIFALSTPFNQFVIEPRYVLAFYTVLPLLGGWAVVQSFERHRFLGLVVSGVLLANIGLGLVKAPPSSFVDPYKLDGAISFFKEKDLPYVNTNGALAHRLMFLTQESLIASVREGGLMDARYHQYYKWVLDAPRDKQAYVYFVDSPELEHMRTEIDHFVGVHGERIIDNRFVVLYPMGAVSR